MPHWLQHLLALTLVAGCLGYVGWQTFRTLRGRGGKIGSCCEKGCSAHAPGASDPGKTAKAGTERIVFIPADSLVARRKRS